MRIGIRREDIEKYRLSDGQMAIGWQEIDGATYFFNGKGQKQTSRWLH